MDIVKYLREAGADVTVADNVYRRTPVHVASQNVSIDKDVYNIY